MDNKKNNNCRDDVAGEYMRKSTANSETKLNKQQQQQQLRQQQLRGEQQQSRFVCTTNSWLIFVTFVKIFAIHHFKQCTPLEQKGAKGRGQGQGCRWK